MFGDRLHLRVRLDKAQAVIEELPSLVAERGGVVNRLRSISPQLEDLFIALLETHDESNA
jgi:hypothetical protein